jgi:hypothetical protein
MSVPGSNPIPFSPPSGEFDVDSVTDLNGNPLGNVIDVDQGFKVNGRVQLPNWPSATGRSASTSKNWAAPSTSSWAAFPSPSRPTQPTRQSSRPTHGRFSSPEPRMCFQTLSPEIRSSTISPQYSPTALS